MEHLSYDKKKIYFSFYHKRGAFAKEQKNSLNIHTSFGLYHKNLVMRNLGPPHKNKICELDLIFYTSSIDAFILNNLNISTITSGANTNPIISSTLFIGKTGILNMCLNAGINSIINISIAEIVIAPSNTLLLNGCVFNIDFLLFLILNTCTSSENAKVTNAIV